MLLTRRRWIALSALAPLTRALGVPAVPPALSPAKIAEVRTLLQDVVKDRGLPGAVWWIERRGEVAQGFCGFRALAPKPEPLTLDTIYDLASLTKVVATAPSVMLLIEQGRLSLDARVCLYLPEFTGSGREFITLKQLLTHTSGLKSGLAPDPPWSGYETGIHLATTTEPVHLPDAEFRYSDINFILLGEIVRRVAGMPLDQFATRHFYTPLKMADTTFCPPPALLPRVAPTEKDEKGTLLRGVVHDPTSRRMGGVTGHAGLFSTITDMARYARMMLHEGELDGVRVLQKETVRLMTSVQTPPAMPDLRGLGWDLDTGYSRPKGALFPMGSFGHTGFTGTCLWLDPASDTFYVFLTSRLQGLKGRTDVRLLYEKLGTLSAQAAGYTIVSGSGI